MSDVIRLSKNDIKMLEEYRQYKITINEDMVNTGVDGAREILECYKVYDLHDLLTRCILTALTQSKDYCEKHNLI